MDEVLLWTCAVCDRKLRGTAGLVICPCGSLYEILRGTVMALRYGAPIAPVVGTKRVKSGDLEP